jgi:hypothetical protein
MHLAQLLPTSLVEAQVLSFLALPTKLLQQQASFVLILHLIRP